MDERYFELERQMERAEHDYLTEPEWDDEDEDEEDYDEVEILTAPRDMYLCKFAVQDYLHRLCMMANDHDGSEQQLDSLRNTIEEYQMLLARLRAAIEEYERP